MNNFQPSEFCPVQFAAVGSGFALLGVTSHNLDIEAMLYDVTNTNHGGFTARIAGKRDAKGTVNADYDADLPPFLPPPFIQQGVSAVMLFYYSALARGSPIQIPVIIGRVHYAHQIGSQTKYSFEASMNILAGVAAYPGGG